MLLLERDDELARLTGLIERTADGGGGLVVLEGPAGIGKTTLLRAAGGIAVRRGLRVLRARGLSLERESGFGVVRQLFGPALAEMPAVERGEVLRGAAGLVAPLFGPGRRPPIVRTEADASFATLHGLYWLVVNLGEVAPVFVVVDDAHWCDAGSLRFIAYLAERVEPMAVAVLLAVRPGESDAADAVIGALAANSPGSLVHPSPLSPVAAATIVRESLSSALAADVCQACHTATAGNPFLLHALLAAIRAERIEPRSLTAASVARVRPESVTRAVLARLRTLSDAARMVARAVAVLGGEAEPRDAAALAGLAPDLAAAGADELRTVGLFSNTLRLEFVHPLIATAVYETIGVGVRAREHARAARILAREHLDSAKVAGHLLVAERAGDQGAVELLRDAGSDAIAAGSPETAARYLRRALEEPPSPRSHGRVLHELGVAELLAGEPGAAGHLREALELSSGPSARAQTAFALGEVATRTGQLALADSVLGEAIDQLGDRNEQLVALLESRRSGLGVLHERYAQSLAERLPRLQALAQAGGAGGRALHELLAFRAAFSGEPHDRVHGLFVGGWQHGRLLGEQSADEWPLIWAVAALSFIDELDLAERILKDMLGRARSRGSINGHVTASIFTAYVALKRGNVSTAECEIRAVLELTARHQLLFNVPFAYACLGEALIERCQTDEAGTNLEAIELGAMGDTTPAALLLLARGRTRLARGDETMAIADLRRSRHIHGTVGFRNPNAVGWRNALALALAHRAPAEARELGDQDLTIARQVGQPRAIGVALRTQALIGPPKHAIELLDQAVRTLQESPAKLEHARALIDYGAALRRAGYRKLAMTPLRDGLDQADRLGATALRGRAREELLAAGARPRRHRISGAEALTVSERRVAQLAGEGMSNREIAESLFISINTVTRHLTHIYQKLRITNRTQLHDALSQTTDHC